MKKRGFVLAILLTFLIVIAGCVSNKVEPVARNTGISSSEPQSTWNKFLTAMKNNDKTTALSLVDPQSKTHFQQMFDEVESMGLDIASMAEGLSENLEECEIREKMALCIITKDLTAINMGKISSDLIFYKSLDGKWLVGSM